MERRVMRPTISDPKNKIARRAAIPRRARTQFDDGETITVPAFDRNDFADAICNLKRLDDGRTQQKHVRKI
jgi:hypothetical protein